MAEMSEKELESQIRLFNLEYPDAVWDWRRRCWRETRHQRAWMGWYACWRRNKIDADQSLADHNQLVRDIDVAINGAKGSARQASLCDIASQICREARLRQEASDG